MAALAPVSTPTRHPFGLLNESKIRSMQSLKNRQNAITPNSAPCLKRRAVSPEAGSDSENIDPNMLNSLNKRKRSGFDDDVSASKACQFGLNVTTISSTPRRLDTPTPRLDTCIKPSPSAPASAPVAAAGRSPTRKRSGLLQTRKRFNPPAFPLSNQSPALSISAALNGTKKSRLQSQARKAQAQNPTQTQTHARTLEDLKPKSWFFDIFEETQEVQEYRMNEWTMTQSATGLDISDDEGKATKSPGELLDRGKENVDPNEPSAPVTRSMAAAAVAKAASGKSKDVDAMIDDERQPLADLNPAKFYAEGLDATSVVLVHDDAEQVQEQEKELDQVQEQEQELVPEPEPELEAGQDFAFSVPAPASTSASLSLTAKAIEALDVPSIGAILSSASPFGSGRQYEDVSVATEAAANKEADGEIEIEIWESQSAKDENERAELDAASPSSVGDNNVFGLQEL
ncbi:hypothetical protein A1O3_00251 [Capronia epimyces CBS 606.96]|uniref:Uncharacterized protein n=1 Tax=Capronia epimyces CBS 606.96 TaxID=1182542 RepID=W9YR09_9EURO|nr:uncharacterized protein A1O3_00251 [Capronia epimyces CBS 606.96]EXJ91701.1 hypothetical protein A1O3_00251 [Capronia epimyces CBS 606.96]